jgi:hypothetical protein
LMTEPEPIPVPRIPLPPELGLFADPGIGWLTEPGFGFNGYWAAMKKIDTL